MKSSFLHIALLALLAAVSCGPSRYMIDVEMRYKSKAGVDLTGKNVAVVYEVNFQHPYGTFAQSLADGFAWNLEADYQSTIDTVRVYGLDKPASEYASRDSLISLLMDTGSDVVFLFDKIDYGQLKSSDSGYVMPFTVSLRCYDAMNQDDKMLSFNGSSTARTATTEGFANEAWEAGKTVATSFKPEWKHEQYSIYYFNTDKWLDALTKAELYEWKQAMDVWFQFLSSNDVLKRSCACFNIATACYMSGDCDLASQWLDKSDKESPLPLSQVLRKRINARK